MHWDNEQHVKRERQKARELRASRWWQNRLQKAACYYCQKALGRDEVTMDHVVPLSRGGRSTPGNVVMSCKDCNTRKKTLTPVEWDEFLRGQTRLPSAAPDEVSHQS